MTFIAGSIIIGSTVAAGAAVYGSRQASKAAGKAADAAQEGAEQQIAFARESRDIVDAQTQPYREGGYAAYNDLLALTGIAAPQSVRNAAVGGDAALGGGPPALDFDPDIEMSETQIQQAYRAVLGRDADPGGLQNFLTQGWRDGGRRRGAYTFNEFLAAAKSEPEWQEKKEKGLLPPTQEGGKYSQNFTGVEIRDPATRKLFLSEAGSAAPAGGGAAAPGAAAPGVALSIGDRVRQDPSYQFRLDEGMRAQQTSAAARGGFGTPFARKATRYAQDYASTEYANLWERVARISGIGGNPTNASTNAALAYGQQAGAAAGNAAYTRGSAYIAQGNATQNAVGQIGQAVGYGVGTWARYNQPDGKD